MEPAAQPEALGDFMIENILGRGGSGIVYAATWGPRRVALKVLHRELVGTGKERAQFLVEAQRLQQIMHPSVVKVLAVGELPDGRPYLAMERLEGETLACVIARGALALGHALELFEELASAVGALHAQGLVHRDLKPENVFVVAGQHAVLLDFGIAKDLTAPASTTTQEGNVRGTPAYMAPERFFGQPAGIATDVYELALLLYAMLAGRLPWDDVADPEARLAPRPLVELADVPESLDVAIRRALSTRVQNRPETAQALLLDVRAAASGPVTEPTAAETARLRSGAQHVVAPQMANDQPARVAPPEQATPLAWAPTVAAPRTPMPPRARRRWPVAVGLALVGLAGGLVAWWRLAGREDAPSRAAVSPPMIDAGAAASPAASRPDDPWGDRPAEPTKVFALVEESLTPAQYRAEAAAAVQRLPGDTRFVFALQLEEVRAVRATADLLDRLLANPRVTAVGLLLPPCVKGIAADAEWIVFGAPGVEASVDGTLIVRGRWRRADVEACFASAVKTHVARDGAKLFRIGDRGWLDFIDDHTAWVTLSTKLDAEALHELVGRQRSAPTRAKQMVAALPADRTLTFVADGKANDDWSELSLPRGTDIYGWIRVEPSGLVLDLAADPHDERAAKAAFARIQPQLDDLFENTSPDAVGRIHAVQDKTVLRLRGNMTSLMLGLVTASLAL